VANLDLSKGKDTVTVMCDATNPDPFFYYRNNPLLTVWR
jgi:hypothetical protein